MSGHGAGIHPVGDVDVVMRQHGFDRAAQQRGIVARHRRDDQQLVLRLDRCCPAACGSSPDCRSLSSATPVPRSPPDRHRRWYRDAEGRLAIAPRASARTFPARRQRSGRIAWWTGDWQGSSRNSGRHPPWRATAPGPHGSSHRYNKARLKALRTQRLRVPTPL